MCFTPVYQVLQITNFLSSVTKLAVYQVLQSGVSSVTITSCIAGVHLLAVSVLRVFKSLAVYQVLVSVSGVTITSFLSVGSHWLYIKCYTPVYQVLHSCVSGNTVKTLYNVTRYNRIFNIRHKIAGNGSVSIKIPSL